MAKIDFDKAPESSFLPRSNWGELEERIWRDLSAAAALEADRSFIETEGARRGEELPRFDLKIPMPACKPAKETVTTVISPSRLKERKLGMSGPQTVSKKDTEMSKLSSALEQLHGELIDHNTALCLFAEKHEASLDTNPPPLTDKAEVPNQRGKIQQANCQVDNCLKLLELSRQAVARVDDVLG